jgi:uncharacterized protein YjiS (DUF1127 family)
MLKIYSAAADAAIASRRELPGLFDARSWRNRFEATVRLWSRRRTTRLSLAELDDHMLRDIGLTPTEARQESSLPFWRSGGRRQSPPPFWTP